MGKELNPRGIQLLNLHEAVLANEPAAREEIAALLLLQACRGLGVEFPGVDSSTLNDAVEDAIMRYLVDPSRYDPSRASLVRFIVVDARFLLLHQIRREATRRDHFARYVGEIAHQFRASSEADDTDMHSQSLKALIVQASQGDERAFLEARVSGVRCSRILASILGRPDASPMEAHTLVKRTADRLIARMRRIANRASSRTR